MEETRTEKVNHGNQMKRWELYTIIALVVAVMAGGFWVAYEYVWTPEVVTPVTTKLPTAEEKSLSTVKTDLEKDASLDLTDIDAEIKVLDAIDLSGV